MRRLPREVRLPKEHADGRDTNGHAVPLQVVAGTGCPHIHQGTSRIQEVTKISLCRVVVFVVDDVVIYDGVDDAVVDFDLTTFEV